MCRKPILRQPNYDDPFFLLTDASAYGVGAVLSQEGETNPRSKKPFLHPIAYYSSTFIPAERNYDIYERELLAVLKSLEHWRPHLAATEKPVMVLTDHANLAFWKKPEKGKQEGSKMVRHPPRLSPPHQTRPRQATRRPRYAIQTT